MACGRALSAIIFFFFFSSRRRHTRSDRDWSSDVCSSDLFEALPKENIAADRTWAATRLRYIGLGYNTKFIAKDEAPKNYDDLLDPKWKSKMAWHAGSDASGALVTISSLLATWGEPKTDAYIAKLARQEITPLS